MIPGLCQLLALGAAEGGADDDGADDDGADGAEGVSGVVVCGVVVPEAPLAGFFLSVTCVSVCVLPHRSCEVVRSMVVLWGRPSAPIQLVRSRVDCWPGPRFQLWTVVRGGVIAWLRPGE